MNNNKHPIYSITRVKEEGDAEDADIFSNMDDLIKATDPFKKDNHVLD